MFRIRRWITARRKVVWSEPGLPPWVKINPQSEPIPTSDPQPGDMSMRAVVEEFLQADDEEAVPEAVEPESIEPESPEEPPPAEPLDPA